MINRIILFLIAYFSLPIGWSIKKQIHIVITELSTSIFISAAPKQSTTQYFITSMSYDSDTNSLYLFVSKCTDETP